MNFDEVAEIFRSVIEEEQGGNREQLDILLNSTNKEIRRVGQLAQKINQERINPQEIREAILIEHFDSFWQKITGFCILKLLREERELSLALDLCERFVGDGIPLQETVEQRIRELSNQGKNESKRAGEILMKNPNMGDKSTFKRIVTPKPTAPIITPKRAKK